MFVMNTAPREDDIEEEETMTPEIWRDIESKMTLTGRDILSYVARHKPTGQFAGYTTVGQKRLQPDLVDQWDTGVDPEHRNKGIGRWVKAAMAFELRDRYPACDGSTPRMPAPTHRCWASTSRWGSSRYWSRT